ncbi:MAG: hypothetical protein M3R50_06905, partial [Bacteroidota bacterium]|nr:hypothetical protein [Bacteroidota bacterium]
MKKVNVFSDRIIWLLLLIISCCIACKKNYITGGHQTDVNQYKNITTFDYLKTVQQFDTLTQLIEAGNLQDQINQQGTFFAVTNTTIFSYLNLKTLYLQNTVNITAKFTLDSLKYYIQNNINGTKDSMLMYLIPGKILTPDMLTADGTLYPSGLQGDTVAVSYEYTRDPRLGYSSLVSTVPQIVYFTQLWQHYEIDKDHTAADVPSGIGV